MIIYNQWIPCSHLLRTAQSMPRYIIPEQSLSEVVLYEDAIAYIRCEIQSTIQHEAAHKDDEAQRDKSILEFKQRSNPGYPYTDLARAAQVIPFNQFTSKSRAEPIAERAEENCEPLFPAEVSGKTVSISLYQLFEEAKTAANIKPQYVQNISAGHLPPEAQGMTHMTDRSNESLDKLEERVKLKSSSGTVHVDEHDNIWVDVRHIVEPFMAKEQNEKDIKPPTYQGPSDGAVQADLPGVSQQPPQGIQAVPGTGSVPTVPARESR